MYFTADAQAFLQDLHAHNDRGWFQANKGRFEASLQEPALRFIEDASQWLEVAGLPYGSEAKKVGGGLSRIYRDSRFSEDKTPYHSHITMYWGHREGSKTKLMPGIGIRIHHDEVGMGAGIWSGATKDLNKIRDAIVARGEDWDAAVAGLELWGDALKTAPRGYPKDHPRIEALRYKQYMATAPLGATELTGDLMAAFQEGVQRMEPFLDFVAGALA